MCRSSRTVRSSIRMDWHWQAWLFQVLQETAIYHCNNGNRGFSQSTKEINANTKSFAFHYAHQWESRRPPQIPGKIFLHPPAENGPSSSLICRERHRQRQRRLLLLASERWDRIVCSLYLRCPQPEKYSNRQNLNHGYMLDLNLDSHA